MATEPTIMRPSSHWSQNNYVRLVGLGEWDVRDDYR